MPGWSVDTLTQASTQTSDSNASRLCSHDDDDCHDDDDGHDDDDDGEDSSDEASDVSVKNKTRARAKGLYRPPRVACPQQSLGFECKPLMNQECSYSHSKQKLEDAVDKNLIRLFSSQYFHANRLLDLLSPEALDIFCDSIRDRDKVEGLVPLLTDLMPSIR